MIAASWRRCHDDQRKLSRTASRTSPATSPRLQISSFIAQLHRALDRASGTSRPRGRCPTSPPRGRPQGNAARVERLRRATIDLDDPFFRTASASTSLVNADFERAADPTRVEVKLALPGPTDGATSSRARRTARSCSEQPDRPREVRRLRRAATTGQLHLHLPGQLHAASADRSSESATVTDRRGQRSTIGVDDVGILDVDIAPGDINWTDVEQSQVRFSYEDAEEASGRSRRPVRPHRGQAPTRSSRKIIFERFPQGVHLPGGLLPDGGRPRVSDQPVSPGRSQEPIHRRPRSRDRKPSRSSRGVGDFESVIRNHLPGPCATWTTANKVQPGEVTVVLNADTDLRRLDVPGDRRETSVTSRYSGRIVACLQRHRPGRSPRPPPTTRRSWSRSRAGRRKASTSKIITEPVELRRGSTSWRAPLTELRRRRRTSTSATKNFVFTSSNGGSTTTTFQTVFFDLSQSRASQWKAQSLPLRQDSQEGRAVIQERAVTDPPS